MNRLLLAMSRLLAPNAESLVTVSNKVNEILKSYVSPVLTVLGSAGAIYIIVLGVQFAKSESEEKRAEAKKRMINCIIGVVIVIALIVVCSAVKWDKVVPDLFGYVAKMDKK